MEERRGIFLNFATTEWVRRALMFESARGTDDCQYMALDRSARPAPDLRHTGSGGPLILFI